MTDPNYTHVVFILDKSGSMASTRDDVIGGFNSLMADQRKVDGKLTVTMCQFDTSYSLCFNMVGSKEVQDLNHDTYRPGGGTALLDAVGRTINEVGDKLRALPGALRPGKVLVVVMTDGQENSSREFTRGQIREMITRQENEYKWNFIYVGANVDGFAEASAIGIRTSNALNYTGDSRGTRRGYEVLSRGLKSARLVGAANASLDLYAASSHVDDVPDNIDVQVSDSSKGGEKKDSTERV